MSLDIWLEIDIDTGGNELYNVNLYHGNYTHNVIPMWSKAGVYDALYNSEGKQAYALIETLKTGIEDMQDKPSEYQELNPENEWGDYEGALSWLEEFTQACEAHPKSFVHIWK